MKYCKALCYFSHEFRRLWTETVLCTAGNRFGGDTEITSNSNKDQLANYSIKDNSLLVTYDREKYISVLYLILICCMSLTVQQHLKKAVI